MLFSIKHMYECDIFVVSYIPDGFEKRYYVVKNRYTTKGGIATDEELIDLLRMSKKPVVINLDFLESVFKEDIIDKIRRAEMKDLIVGGDSL